MVKTLYTSRNSLLKRQGKSKTILRQCQADELADLYCSNLDSFERMFPGISKNINTVKRSFKTACNKAGIDNLRFHDLRHTCATRLVEFGIPLHTVAKLLGHSSIRTTERYSHPEDTLRDAVDILANNT